MKKALMVWVMALAMTMTFCGKDKEKDQGKDKEASAKKEAPVKQKSPEELLIGKWTPVKMISEMGEQEAEEGEMGILDFTADGRLTFIDPAGEQSVGGWKLLSETKMELTSPTGEKEEAEFKITGDKLILVNSENQQTLECNRIKL